METGMVLQQQQKVGGEKDTEMLILQETINPQHSI
jgi:hypothetical protein